MSQPLDLDAIKTAPWRPYCGPEVTEAVDLLVAKLETSELENKEMKLHRGKLILSNQTLRAQVEKLKADRETLSKAVDGVLFVDSSKEITALKVKLEDARAERNTQCTLKHNLISKIEKIREVLNVS